MKQVFLVVVKGCTAPGKPWYSDHIGHLFFVTPCSDSAYYAIVVPIVGSDNDIQIKSDFIGNGVIQVEDVTILNTLNVI